MEVENTLSVVTVFAFPDFLLYVGTFLLILKEIILNTLDAFVTGLSASFCRHVFDL